MKIPHVEQQQQQEDSSQTIFAVFFLSFGICLPWFFVGFWEAPCVGHAVPPSSPPTSSAPCGVAPSAQPVPRTTCWPSPTSAGTNRVLVVSVNTSPNGWVLFIFGFIPWIFQEMEMFHFTWEIVEKLWDWTCQPSLAKMMRFPSSYPHREPAISC